MKVKKTVAKRLLKKPIDPAFLERRARKAARREKQRETNITRAKEMHQVFLEYKKTPHPPIQQKLFKYYIGCSGWFYWHWRGIFYPENSQPNVWFEHYAKTFNTVELNAPFYSWPSVNTVKTWLRQTRDKNFIYTIKVSELITHIKKFKSTKQLVQDFSFISDLLGKNMGCLLFQLPPSFSYTPARLKNILAQLNPAKRNVIEFRHASWWNETVYKAFKKTKTIFCSCSAPQLPEALIETAEDVYIRFHGLEKWYRYDYSDAELTAWAKQIKKSKAKRFWIYFNNDREGNAIKNAKRLMALIN